MIPIYICEDNLVYLEKIKKEINDYILIQNYDMSIQCATTQPSEIISFIKDNPMSGIYFLDVDLQDHEYDGFSLGQAIRKVDTSGFVIFITTHGELSFNTFKYRLEAMDYIIKDDTAIIQTRIRECLDSIQERINNNTSDKQFYAIKILNEIYNIEVASINCFETSNQKHRLILTTDTQQLEFFGKLTDVEKDLGDNFIRIHRSYLINKNKIKTIDLKRNILTLTNNQECLISRTMKSKLRALL